MLTQETSTTVNDKLISVGRVKESNHILTGTRD